ncbi:polyprotein [Phytophthora megakarya]|uniref:Polyprotein n=1 Tax=Phytophthora megakarya TaxID=4795 RepID=A0A225W173_9STRA|nr:polyprotein [Phytophthora megakarya]
MASQNHIFVFGMREGTTRFSLTRAEPDSWEKAFALARTMAAENKTVVEHGFPPMNEMVVEQGFPPKIKSVVERGFPPLNEETHEVHLRIDERGLSHLEGSESSFSERVASPSSSHSKRRKKSKCRRLKPRRFTSSESTTTESVCATEYVEGSPQRQRVIEIGNPPSDAPSLTQLPGLSWKKFLRELKAGEIKHVCLIADADAALHSVNAVTSDEASSRSKNAEPKSSTLAKAGDSSGMTEVNENEIRNVDEPANANENGNPSRDLKQQDNTPVSTNGGETHRD